MSRLKIAFRIERVLSAIRASLNQRFPAAPKFWAAAKSPLLALLLLGG
jgi:hypothetical protein